VCFYGNSNGSENSSYSCGLTSAPQLFSGKPTRRNMSRQLMYFYNIRIEVGEGEEAWRMVCVGGGTDVVLEQEWTKAGLTQMGRLRELS
jgi:hypothetical protein